MFVVMANKWRGLARKKLVDFEKINSELLDMVRGGKISFPDIRRMKLDIFDMYKKSCGLSIEGRHRAYDSLVRDVYCILKDRT